MSLVIQADRQSKSDTSSSVGDLNSDSTAAANPLQNYVQWIKKDVFCGSTALQLPYLSKQGCEFQFADPINAEHFVCEKCGQFPRDPTLCTPITDVAEPIRMVCDICAPQSVTGVVFQANNSKSVDSCVRQIMSTIKLKCLACETTVFAGPEGRGGLIHVSLNCKKLMLCLCGEQFSRLDFDPHFAACSKRQVSCRFGSCPLGGLKHYSHAGCTWKGTRLQHKEHLIVCPAKLALREFIRNEEPIPLSSDDEAPLSAVSGDDQSQGQATSSTDTASASARSRKRPLVASIEDLHDSDMSEIEKVQQPPKGSDTVASAQCEARPTRRSSRAKKTHSLSHGTRYYSMKSLNDTHVHMLVNSHIPLRMKLMCNAEGSPTRLFVALTDLASWVETETYQTPGLTESAIKNWFQKGAYSHGTDCANVLLQHCRVRTGATDEPAVRPGSIVEVHHHAVLGPCGYDSRYYSVELGSSASVTTLVSDRVIHDLHAHLSAICATLPEETSRHNATRYCMKFFMNILLPTLRLTQFKTALGGCNLKLMIIRGNQERLCELCMICHQRVDSSTSLTCSEYRCEGKCHRACLDEKFAPISDSPWRCPDCVMSTT